MIKKFVKFPKDKSKKEIRQFFLNKSLESFIRKSSQKSMEVNDMITNKPYKPLNIAMKPKNQHTPINILYSIYLLRFLFFRGGF